MKMFGSDVNKLNVNQKLLDVAGRTQNVKILCVIYGRDLKMEKCAFKNPKKKGKKCLALNSCIFQGRFFMSYYTGRLLLASNK